MQSNPTKYKVCIISALYEPYGRGGAEKIAELVACGLLENGHKVFVVTSKPWQGFFSLLPKVSTPSSAQGGSASGGNSPYPRQVGAGGEIIFAPSPCFRKTEIGGGGGGVKIYRFFPLNIFSFANIGKYTLFFRLIWRILDTFNLHSFLVLWYILKKEQPDFVWTQNITGLGLLTPMLLKILKIPHIHTLHDVSLIEPSGLIVKDKENGGLLIRLVWSAITRKLFGSPLLVVSPSKWLLDFYLEHRFFSARGGSAFGGKNSKVLVKQNPVEIPLNPPLLKGENPYPTSPFQKGGGKEGDLEKKEIKKDEINFLYIGQLEKQKGILFLISILEELARPHPIPRLRQVGAGIPVVENDLGTSPSPREGEEGGGGFNFNLSVVGTGKLLPLLKKMAETRDWLTVYGKLDGEDISKIWKKTNLTIVPSLIYENSPTVIYESLSRGIPVIASRIGGIPELVEDNKNGLLFEAGDGKDLKNKLIQILQNPQILDNLKQKALTFEAKTPIIYVREILDVII